MAVHPKRYRASAPVTRPPLVAADILKPEHPLNGAFLAWLQGATPSKRQARAYLAQFPQLTQEAKAA